MHEDKPRVNDLHLLDFLGKGQTATVSDNDLRYMYNWLKEQRISWASQILEEDGKTIRSHIVDQLGGRPWLQKMVDAVKT